MPEVVFRPWSVELNGLKNESPHGECLVSYLAVPRLPPHTEDVAGDDTPETFSLARRFTRCYGGATPVSVGEPACFDDGGSGADTANIVRARPIDAPTGAASMVLELVDLLHIQLRCLAGDAIVRGAVVIDCLHVGSNRDGAYTGPALSRVREMAANEAVFPRIAVADEIVRRLRADESLWTQGHFLRAEVDLVDCMLRADGSGVHYIDYLKAALGEFDYDFGQYAAFLQHHKQLVESGLAERSPGNTPETFGWLKKYHNARIDEDLARPEGIAQADECDQGMASVLTPLRIA